MNELSERRLTFMKKLIATIEDAFCWEGDAQAKLALVDGNMLKFSVKGSSDCEHTGDSDNIVSNSVQLRGQTFEEDGYKYTIISTSCNIQKGDRDEDGGFTAYVNGGVVAKKEKI
jgi:hypothetical protein